MITTILFAVLCAAANRFSGYTNIEKLPGRNVYYAALALGLVATVTLGWVYGIAALLSMLTYRLPGWNRSIDMGVNEDSLRRDARTMFYRGLFAAPFFLVATYHLSWFAPLFLIFGAMGGVAAYVLGNYVLAHIKSIKDPFVYVELLVGASIGAMAGLSYVMAAH